MCPGRISQAVRAEVLELYAEYAALLDEGPLERWPALFVSDCSYRVVPRENYDRGLPLAAMRCDSRAMLEDRVNAVVNLSVYAPRQLLHFISNYRIGEDAEEIVVRANYAVYQTDVEGTTRVLNVGRYIDRLASNGGSFLFRDKVCVYDTVMIDNALIVPI